MIPCDVRGCGGSDCGVGKVTGIDGYDWSVLGCDNPAPGDPEVFRRTAVAFLGQAKAVTSQGQTLAAALDRMAEFRQAGDADRWDEVESSLVPLMTAAVAIRAAYEGAADAVNAYWPALQAAQVLAVSAWHRGKAAQGEILAATARVVAAQAQVDQAGAACDAAASASEAVRPAGLAEAYRVARAGLAAAQASLGEARMALAAAVALKDQAAAEAQEATAKFAAEMAPLSRMPSMPTVRYTLEGNGVGRLTVVPADGGPTYTVTVPDKRKSLDGRPPPGG